MYNEERKSHFIKSYTESVHTARCCRSLFNTLEPFEERFETDVCAMTNEQLTPIMEQIVGLRSQSKWQRINILRDYARWCMAMDIKEATPALLEVMPTGLEKLREQTVSNPAHLEKYLNEICEPAEHGIHDNIYRCFYWLAFAGMDEADIFEVKTSDVDFTTMTVKFGGAQYPIYREGVQAFRNCACLKAFRQGNLTNCQSSENKLFRQRVEGDQLLRGIRGSASIKTMRMMLSRLSAKRIEQGRTKMKLSYYRVWLSGLFYRTLQNEQMGIKPDFSDVTVKTSRVRVYKLYGSNTQEGKLVQVEKDYMKDYDRWKLAYKL